MNMNGYVILLDSNISTVIENKSNENQSKTTQQETTQSTGEPAKSGIGGFLGNMNIVTTALLYGGLFLALYFLMIRPQKKREKEARALVAAIKVGDNIVTSSGFYGVVASLGEDCFIVDFGTNKGIRIPVRKGDVIGVQSPVLTPPKENKDEDAN